MQPDFVACRIWRTNKQSNPKTKKSLFSEDISIQLHDILSLSNFASKIVWLKKRIIVHIAECDIQADDLIYKWYLSPGQHRGIELILATTQ